MSFYFSIAVVVVVVLRYITYISESVQFRVKFLERGCERFRNSGTVSLKAARRISNFRIQGSGPLRSLRKQRNYFFFLVFNRITHLRKCAFGRFAA